MEMDDWIIFHVACNIDDIAEDLGIRQQLIDSIVEEGEADITLSELDRIKLYVRSPEIMAKGLKQKTKELQESDPSMFAGTTIPEGTPTVKKGASDEEVMNFICSMMDQIGEFKEKLSTGEWTYKENK